MDRPSPRPIVIEDPVAASYERRYRAAIDAGTSIYEITRSVELAGHERRMQLLDGLDLGDLSGKTCVDYGVGSWGFASVFPKLQRCGLAIGIDVSPTAVEASRRISAEGDLPYGDRWRYLTTEDNRIDLDDGSVDVFFAGECIEHVENTDAFLDEVHRVLADDGLFVLTTPNADAYLYRVQGDRFGVGAEHVALLSYDELCGALRPRFDIVGSKGFNWSLHRSLDDQITDPDVSAAWAAQFEDRPDLATGVVVAARRRNDYRGHRYVEDRLHHDDGRVVYRGEWAVAPLLDDEVTGRLADGEGDRSLHFRVRGTDLLVFLWTHPWSGEVELDVDGDVSTHDLFSPVGGFLRLHVSDLADVEHEVALRATGRADRRSHADQVIFYQAIGYSRVPS